MTATTGVVHAATDHHFSPTPNPPVAPTTTLPLGRMEQLNAVLAATGGDPHALLAAGPSG